jgi:hypothetical protein
MRDKRQHSARNRRECQQPHVWDARKATPMTYGFCEGTGRAPLGQTTSAAVKPMRSPLFGYLATRHPTETGTTGSRTTLLARIRSKRDLGPARFSDNKVYLSLDSLMMSQAQSGEAPAEPVARGKQVIVRSMLTSGRYQPAALGPRTGDAAVRSVAIGPARFLHDQLASASPDLLRSMLTTFVNTPRPTRSAAPRRDALARPGERPQRLPAPRLRHPGRDPGRGHSPTALGQLFPDWLLERRRRVEVALTSVVAPCYQLGVSTRRMEKLVESLDITRLSRSQVSEMARDLDAQVEAFRTRPLDVGPYTFVAADALVLKVREGGRVVNTCMPCWPPGSTLTGTGRSSACRSPRPRTARDGSDSSGT